VRVGPTTTTTYNLQVTLDGCTSITSKQVVVVGAVIPSISIAKDSVCKGDSTTITASGGLTYKWLPGGATTATITAKPPATTTYSCVITTACGKDTLTEKLTILPYPVIGLSHDTTICVGQSATLSATGGISYLWSNGATTSTISVAPGTTKTYTLAVSNGKCIKDTTVTVNVNNPPTITITPDQKVCQGSSVTLTATSTGSSYLWSNGATTSSITVTPTSTTTYTVTSSNGCPTKDSTEVFVLTPALTACCDTTIISGDTVTINAYGDVSYIWSPSTSLSCSTCPNPVASPTVTTTYTVVSTDSNGCKTSREVTVFVECVDFVVPNVFTPNNDGRNDDFVPYYIIGGTIHNGVGNVSSYTITIYDRWGKQVYNSSDPTKYWNGTLNNTNYLVPDGVYYYIIKATCGGNNYDHHGFVQVLGGGAK
jgi:gliding motility-associated-like protein